jgi:hypothetical protein
MESLYERYFNSLIPYVIIYNREFQKNLQATVLKNRFSDILSSNLKIKGFVEIGKKIVERRTFETSLSDNEQCVDEQLNSVKFSMKNSLENSFFFRPMLILIFLRLFGKGKVSQIKEEIPCSFNDLKELEEMNLITQKIDESNGKKENYVMLTEKGEEVLCKIDETEKIVKR